MAECKSTRLSRVRVDLRPFGGEGVVEKKKEAREIYARIRIL